MIEMNTATRRTVTSVQTQLVSVKLNAVKNFFKLGTAMRKKKKKFHSTVMYSAADYHRITEW